jgi:branched-chain amino acid transport system substrate-binding protein
MTSRRAVFDRRFVIPLIGAALLASACGTRVPMSEIAAVDGDALVQAGVQTEAAAGSGGGAGVGVSDALPDAGGPSPSGDGASAGPVGGAAAPAATDASAAGGASGSACAKPGPPLVLGSVGGYSGLLGPVFAPGREALEMWRRTVNAEGGVACHPVELKIMDDASDPARSQAAVQTLINGKVSAFIASYNPISIAGYISGINGTGVPTIGGDTTNPDWNTHPLLFNVGAGFDSGIFIGLRAAAEAGTKKLGVLLCVEASPCSSAKPVIYGGLAEEAGMQIVPGASGPISLTQTDFTAQCQSAKNAGADAFFIAADGGAIARLARSCKSVSYFPTIVTVAVAASFDATDPNFANFKVIVGSNVFPFPSRGGSPGLDRWAAAIRQHRPAVVNGASSIAFASGEMLRLAIESLGPEARTMTITPEMVRRGLGNLKGVTGGGLFPPTTFTFDQPFAPDIGCGYVVEFSGGAWRDPRQSQVVCR